MAENITRLNETFTDNDSNRIYTEGPIFDMYHANFMSVNIWPLVFVFIYAFLGFFGNSVVIYVYWTKWKKNKTRVFILCLAILDWLNCAFNMPVEVAVLWHPLTFDMNYLCKISRGITFVINNTGSLVFVSIAIERYMLVYHPLKYRRMTPKFAKLMCLAAFIIASSVSWPSFVFYGTFTLKLPVKTGGIVLGKTCLISDEYKNRTSLTLIFTTVLFGLMILTFIILSALYIAIGRKIYLATCTDIGEEENEHATKLFGKSILCALTGGKTKFDKLSYKRQLSNYSTSIVESPSCYETSEISRSYSPVLETDGNAHNSNATNGENKKKRLSLQVTIDKRIPVRTLEKQPSRISRKFSMAKARPTRKNTVMMRVVTIAFMMSFTPFLIILIIRYTNSDYYSSLDIPGKIVYSVFLRTYFINSMVNPFIYGFMNLRFRQHVKSLFINLLCCGRLKST